MRRPWPTKDVVAEQRGIWWKILTSSRIRTKLRLVRVMLAPYSKSPQKNWRLCGDPGPHSGNNQWWSANNRRKNKQKFTIWASSWLQLLEETPAVLSLGKLCEDHGYSHEWVSGQKTTVDQRREDYYMQNGQFHTACCSQVVRQFWWQFVFNIDIAGFVFSKSSPRTKWRTCSRRLVHIILKCPKPKLKEDGMRDLPEWFEEFTVHLEDTEVPALTHISQDSDSERPTKVVAKSREHSVYTHVPKDRNCELLLRTKMTRAPCRRRTGEAPPQAAKFGDLITADHLALKEGGNVETIIDMLSWCKIWPLIGFSRTRAKHRLLTRWKGVYECFSSCRKKPKVIYTDISLEFGKSCEDLSWNHRTSTPHRWHWWKSRTTIKRRYFSSVATIWIWLYGMLLLPAK